MHTSYVQKILVSVLSNCAIFFPACENPSEMKSSLILHKHFQSPPFIQSCYSRKCSKKVKQILHHSTNKYQLFIHAGDETLPHLILQISTSKSPHRRWVRKEGMVYNAEKALCIARAHTTMCLGGVAVWKWNALHRSMCLNIWCPAIGAVWRDCGATGCGC